MKEPSLLTVGSEVSHNSRLQRPLTRIGRDYNRAVDDEAVEIPIEDTFDLHPFRPSEIKDVARDYLFEAHARGFRQVRLIHGRGIGVQRERIRALLVTLPFVEEFLDADPSGGGWGSTVVSLAESRSDR